MYLVTIAGVALATVFTMACLNGADRRLSEREAADRRVAGPLGFEHGPSGDEPGGTSGQKGKEGREMPTETTDAKQTDWATVNLFTMEAETLDGERLRLSTLRGKVLLIVNVASRCGYTRQYADLQALHERYADRGLVVIAVPSNEFGSQEPGTAEEIQEFCTRQFGVTFALLAKAEVKPGDKQHPIFRALVARTDEVPKWNFTKYLVARDGIRATGYPSRVSPQDEAFIEIIERLLAESAPKAEPAPTT